MKIKFEESPAVWVEGEIHSMFYMQGIKFYIIAKDHPGRPILVVREFSQIEWPKDAHEDRTGR